MANWHEKAARDTWRRIAGRAAPLFEGDADRLAGFAGRVARHGPRLIARLHDLYGWTYDFYHHLETILLTAAAAAAARPADLVALDRQREAEPDWFADHKALGGVAYVDLFAGRLGDLAERIAYFRRLGLTYLHLMPLFARPAVENDGGYAVSDYRRVHPPLGTMDDLERLAKALREAGISLVADFILNHTSDEHPWAEAAKAGDTDAQDFYWMFDDRRQPDRIAPHLRAIFPDRGGDAFTFRPDVPGPHGGRWVWTTFYTFQWDLNYRNPAVITAIAGEMLHLANRGIEVLRLDAVPFLWKEAGTNCENRPEAHVVVEILNAVAAIAAPALAFKSEAIVHPDDVVRYVSTDECRLSYNPLVMALAWEALATADTRLLRDALTHRHQLPEATGWVTYLRCHDDIGWGFADEDARRLGIDPAAHRAYLNAFYTGRFPGSFARGLPFQENPATGDCRICGTLASLAGLEAALEAGDPAALDLAIARITLLNGLILTVGGLPLIYLGDEIGQMNDYGFRADPARAGDARWVHRPAYPWARRHVADHRPATPEGRIAAAMETLLAFRRQTPALGRGRLEVLPLGDNRLLAYRRQHAAGTVTLVANLSALPVSLSHRDREIIGPGLCRLTGAKIAGEAGDLAPYAFLAVVPEPESTP